MRRNADEPAGENHADSGEREGGTCGDPVASERRVETAVEKNDGKRQGADKIGDAARVEFDAEEAVLPGEEADAQKYEKQGSADTPGDKAGQCAERDEPRAQKDRQIDDFRQSGPLVE